MKFNYKKLIDYPISPGVYLMKNAAGDILYIGKAKNLRVRLKQYFMLSGDTRWIIPYLQELVTEIDTIVTLSEKDALLLENTLIKKHKPRYNALLKDDKTYAAIKINNQHEWPMLSLIRYKGEPKKDGLYFGPYTSAHSARQTLDLLQRLYPLRQCSDQELARRKRPCILYDMKRCSAPCVNLVDKPTYSNYVEGAIEFLKGDDEQVVKNLQVQLEEASNHLQFERASEIYALIQAIGRTLEIQSVDKLSHRLSGDVLGVFRQGDEVILSQLMFHKGKLSSYQHHNFSKIVETDEELIESFLLQNYAEKQRSPEEIIIPIEIESLSVVEEILNQNRTKKIHLLNPKRGEKKGLLDMAYQNAEASYKQQKDENAIRGRVLMELQEHLFLLNYPKTIECIDTSHLSGTESVSSLVAFNEGLPDKNRYRRYKLRSSSASDDYGALREVLLRRYDKPIEERDLPDMLMVDGGKGHLNMASEIFRELNIISIDLIGIAKEEGRHDKGMTKEAIYRPDLKDPIYFSSHSPLLFLLQRIRDEAHRFAITYQKKRRSKSLIKSEIAEIPGIGPKKMASLFKKFGSAKRIFAATYEELKEVSALSEKDVQGIIQAGNSSLI